MDIVYGNNDVVNDPNTKLLKWITGFVFQPMECIHYLVEDNVILMTVFQPFGTPVGTGAEELLTSAMSERCHVTFSSVFFFFVTVTDWLLILGIKQLSMWCLFGLYSLSNLPALRNFLSAFSHNGSLKLIRAECMSLLTAAKYSEFLYRLGLNNTRSS